MLLRRILGVPVLRLLLGVLSGIPVISKCQLSNDWRANLLLQIKDKFTTTLDPSLLEIILVGLSSYLSDIAPNWHDRFSSTATAYNNVIRGQSLIGWDHFFRGKLHKDWGIIQYYHAKRFNLRKESEGWILRLLRLMSTAAIDA